jgi:hypothetical protein
VQAAFAAGVAYLSGTFLSCLALIALVVTIYRRGLTGLLKKPGPVLLSTTAILVWWGRPRSSPLKPAWADPLRGQVSFHFMSAVHRPVTHAEARAAARRIAGSALRTPLVRLNVDDAPAEIYLKLENLQPIGSFKIRGAANAMALASREASGSGVWTASAGNMAQGVAWCARSLGVPCSVVVHAFSDGGLTCGIASILRQHSPRPKVLASEVSTGPPLRASMEAGKPVEVDYVPSFVDGIGARSCSQRCST